MNDKNIQTLPHIGKKLRAARRAQRLSLRELAAKADVSASLLSKVENGKANPSVRSLHSIADALSIPVHYFFPEKKEEAQITVELPGEPASDSVNSMTLSQLRITQAAALIDNVDLGFDGKEYHSKEPVVRAGARPTIELKGGVTWTRLTPSPEDEIEFLEVRYDVGAKSGAKMSHHAGRELHLVLEGELLLELAFERYLLKVGDSIIFDSAAPHRLSNAGQTPLRAVSVIFNRK
jgi:transcriptional regulator with XRE-family HTH domain/quercetin dioxygenase-like cupin family protein